MDRRGDGRIAAEVCWTRADITTDGVTFGGRLSMLATSPSPRAHAIALNVHGSPGLELLSAVASRAPGSTLRRTEWTFEDRSTHESEGTLLRVAMTRAFRAGDSRVSVTVVDEGGGIDRFAFRVRSRVLSVAHRSLPSHVAWTLCDRPGAHAWCFRRLGDERATGRACASRRDLPESSSSDYKPLVDEERLQRRTDALNGEDSQRAPAFVLPAHLVLEQIRDAVVAIDPEGRVTYWGNGAVTLYQFARSEALGRPLTELYTYRWSSPDDEREAIANLAKETQNLHTARRAKVEQFLLDIRRGRIDLLKGKYQARARQVVVLVRLDFGGAPHRNPDDQEIGNPHLHLYREGYGDKWAVEVPVQHFPRTSDLWGTLEDFMKFCRVTLPPYIERGLFT